MRLRRPPLVWLNTSPVLMQLSPLANCHTRSWKSLAWELGSYTSQALTSDPVVASGLLSTDEVAFHVSWPVAILFSLNRTNLSSAPLGGPNSPPPLPSYHSLSLSHFHPLIFNGFTVIDWALSACACTCAGPSCSSLITWPAAATHTYTGMLLYPAEVLLACECMGTAQKKATHERTSTILSVRAKHSAFTVWLVALAC